MKPSHSRKRKLGSYPSISVIFSITFSLLVMGMFGLVVLLTTTLTRIIQENVEIQVFLNKSISSSEITRIQKTIGSKPYVSVNQNLQGITHITRDQAAAQFMEDTGEDFTSFLGDNPLRDVLLVKINPDYQTVDSLSRIQKEIEAYGGVFEVSYVESLVESINNNLAKIGAILMGFSFVLLIVVTILINNTIKLALFSQRFLIRSMQLVGATGSFIRRPFLSRAAFYGLLSGLIASGLLYGLLLYANRQIEDLSQLQNFNNLLLLFGVLLVVGILVAYLSTYRAMNKYLKISLDELY